MKQSKFRALVLASVSSFTLLSAFACGSLDSRDITRGPDEAVNGGDPNGPDGTGNKSSGGSDSLGGETNLNPFGGESPGGAPPVVDGPPEVVDVLPADAADDADPTDVLGLKFSEALDDTTVTSDSIKLLDGDTEISGKLAYAGVAATLKPSQRLSLLASYDVQVTQDITDTGGQKLKAPFASKFTVRDGAWGDQKAVFQDQTAWGGQQEVATDAAGNAFVVWSTIDPITYASTGCVVRRFNVRAGWENPVTISDPTENCYNLRVAVSPEGDAIVAWFGGEYPAYVVRARRFINGDWEAAPQNVDKTAQPLESTGELSVSIRGGQSLVAWITNKYFPAAPPTYPTYHYEYYLFLATAAADGDWPMAPTQNDSAFSVTPDYDSIGSVSSAIDDQGNSLVLLNHYSSNANPDYKGVFYLRKAVSGNWQYATKIPSSLPADAGPELVSDGSGAMAIWESYDQASSSYLMLASRYTKAKQFVAPVQIQDPDLKDSIYLLPQHSLVSNGTSYFACWRQYVGSAANAYATKFDVSTGKWDATPTIVSDGVMAVGPSTSVGMDAHGNAIFVFDLQQQGESSPLMWSRYTASDGKWSAATVVTESDQFYRSPVVTVADNGVAVMLFGAGRNVGHGGVQGLLGGQYRIFQ